MGSENREFIINLITTGGTIAKTYDEGDGSLANRQLAISLILKHLRLPHTQVRVHPLMNRDSLTFTEVERDKILNKIKELIDEKHPIVVIHGTDTMTLTAEYCQKEIKRPKVPIVFTGAMRPIELRQTDGHQNVAEALLACRLLSKGFYICFHNQVFKVGQVEKNHRRHTFQNS